MGSPRQPAGGIGRGPLARGAGRRKWGATRKFPPGRAGRLFYAPRADPVPPPLRGLPLPDWPWTVRAAALGGAGGRPGPRPAASDPRPPVPRYPVPLNHRLPFQPPNAGTVGGHRHLGPRDVRSEGTAKRNSQAQAGSTLPAEPASREPPGWDLPSGTRETEGSEAGKAAARGARRSRRVGGWSCSRLLAR